ncbi:MAG: TRAP transporter small permease subunit, partial [Spirochaetales bacterium]|nr:TRAP transporter small permease subunit [Spirochaetales bacterium]
MMNLFRKAYNRVEFIGAVLIFLLLAFIPVLEILSRLIFSSGIRGADSYVSHSVLWVAFLAGMIASRDNAHLSLTSGKDLFTGKLEIFTTAVSRIFSAAICFGLASSAFSFLFIGFDPGRMVGLFPMRLVLFIIPLGFLVMGIRFFLLHDDGRRWVHAHVIVIAVLLGAFLSIPSMTNMLYKLMAEPPMLLDSHSMFYYDFYYNSADQMNLVLHITIYNCTPI